MASNWQTKLGDSLSKLAEQVQSALTLDIYTYATDINKTDTDTDKRRALAETHLTPEGDIKQTVPAEFKDGTIVVNQELYEVHLMAVEQAVQTRKELLNAVKELLDGMHDNLA